MDCKCEKQASGGFGNGLLFGLLLGGGITFLLTTQKGRRLLGTLSHEGLEKGEELGRNLMDKYLGDEENLDMSEEEAEEVRDEAKRAVRHLKKPTKRVFRGVRR